LLVVVEVFTILDHQDLLEKVVVLVDHMLGVVMVRLPTPVEMQEKTLEVVVDLLMIQSYQEMVVLVSSLFLILLDKYQKNCYNSK
jgi:hypothetical protein